VVEGAAGRPTFLAGTQSDCRGHATSTVIAAGSEVRAIVAEGSACSSSAVAALGSSSNYATSPGHVPGPRPRRAVPVKKSASHAPNHLCRVRFCVAGLLRRSQGSLAREECP
jgi:hypothetical protein